MLRMSSLSVDPAYWLGKILPYIPTPKKSSRRGKIIFSAILALIFLFLCVPLKSEKNPYEGDMRAFSPSQQAREILKNNGKDGPQATLDYITFYQNLPNAKMDAELEKIKAEAEAHRGVGDKLADFVGAGKRMAGDVLGEQNVELLLGVIAGLAPAGVDPRHWIRLFDDGKNVYENWHKFRNNENINSVDLAMDGAGFLLGVTAVMPGPVGKSAESANKAIGPIRKTWQRIPRKTKDYIFNAFQPVFVCIKHSQLMEFNPTDLRDFSTFFKSKKDQLPEVVTKVQSAFDNLGPILVLSTKNEPLAEVVMLNSASPKELEANLRLANELTNEYMDILKFGGPEAFRAAERLKERGELNPQVLKAAMVYGPAGLNAVGHVPSADILKGDFASRRAYSWLQILLLVLYIPYFCLAMIKIWRPELAHAGGVKEA